ncbi:MAG: hypothetical protein N2205_08630 [Candidatus Caldatribacterium sp.]|uniref:hypothetical protein n=1 Tax=Candidatus Caldatribacterium sp. TaxID=2282143 RepID=UPI00299BE05A|nr:hypothetical protein [Candidatus Caldatribacterium sp.]MCX7731262.1 hypothetical protein [Candidatus Caldatribacterium sp.]MDW8081462.1 hypothetical protein [Candidatus Calescibacterium sp.]
MTTTILSFLWGMALAFFLLVFILREVQTLLKKRSYSPWRGILFRESIAGAWLYTVFRYGQVKLNIFMIAFLVSYFSLVVFFARCFFKEVGSCGRGA